MNACNPSQLLAGPDDVFWVDSSPNSLDAGDIAYSIGDLARKFNVSLRTLRFYESRGLLSPSRAGRQRVYPRKQADRLNVILKAKKLGFTLAEIRQMIAEGRDEASRQALKLSREKCLEQIGVFERKLAEIEEALAELRWIYTSLSAKMVETRPAADETN